MKKLAFIFFFIIFSFLISFSPANATITYPCGNDKFITFSENPLYLSENNTVTFIVEGNLSQGTKYLLELSGGSWEKTDTKEYQGNPLTFTEPFYIPNNVKVSLVIEDAGSNTTVCTVNETLIVDLTPPTSNDCNITINPNPADLNDIITIYLTGLQPGTQYLVSSPSLFTKSGSADNDSTLTITIEPSNRPNQEINKKYKIRVDKKVGAGEFAGWETACQTDKEIEIKENIPDDGSDPSIPGSGTFDPTQYECLGGKGFKTAIGCIPTQIGPFAQYIFNRAIPLAGSIALLLLLFGAFTLITSAGNPEKIKLGQQIITSAITGLLFIILAVFLLKLISEDVLNLPGFPPNPPR